MLVIYDIISYYKNTRSSGCIIILFFSSQILQKARHMAIETINDDPALVKPRNENLNKVISGLRKNMGIWSNIS